MASFQILKQGHMNWFFSSVMGFKSVFVTDKHQSLTLGYMIFPFTLYMAFDEVSY